MTSDSTPPSAAEIFAKIFPGRTGGPVNTSGPTAAELAQANRDAFTTYHQRHTPHLFAQAVTDHPQVQDWAAHYLRNMIGSPSLLLAGSTGTGKTHHAYGALRYLAVSGWPVITWKTIEAVEFYARLRPGGVQDPEAEFFRHAKAPLLLFDDLGATRHSSFIEEMTLRLINHRYAAGLPMIITTNIVPTQLSTATGDRIGSRLRQMCQVIDFGTEDRRSAPKAA